MQEIPKNWGSLRTWIWINHYQFSGSKDTAASILKNLPIPENLGIAKIDRAVLRAVITALRQDGKGDATVRRYMTVLCKALKEAMKEGYLDSVPAMPSLPKIRKGRVRYLVEDEESTLFAHAQLEDVRFASMLVVLVDTGMRLGEALRLEWTDIDDASITIQESKNGDKRKIPTTSRVRWALAEMNPVGVTPRTGPYKVLQSHNVHRCWNRCKKAMGLEDDTEFVPHCLRHTFASRLVQLGVGLQVVKELLGHKRLENTMIYAHLAPAQHVAAIALLESRQ